MFIQPVSVFVINAYFLGLNMVALRVVVERKIPMMFVKKCDAVYRYSTWYSTVPGTVLYRYRYV